MYPRDTYALGARFEYRGIIIPLADVNTLRRAEKTLRGWFEAECGDGDEWGSWALERDPETDKPYRVVYPNTGKVRRYSVPDREKGARRRVADVCTRNGLHYYIQSDPRGGALYVSREPLNDSNYNIGVGMYV